MPDSPASPAAEPVYLTVPQAAARCGLSRRVLRQMIHAGELPGYRVRRRILVAARDLDRHIRSRPAVPPAIAP